MTIMNTVKAVTRMQVVMIWSLYMLSARLIENTLYFLHDMTMLLMRIYTLNQVPVFASKTYYEPAQTRFIVVTGTSSGIGNHCALQLARMGYSVIATVRKDKDMENWNYIEEATNGLKGKIIPLWVDLSSPESIFKGTNQMKSIIREHNGKLVALINNAGIPGPFCPFELVDLERDMQVMDVNWRGTLICTQQLLPMLRESRGRIIVLSSILGRLHIPWLSPYTMSKAALEAFCDSLRLELVNYGVSVSMLEPGFVDTKIMDKIEWNMDQYAQRVQKNRVYFENYQKALVFMRLFAQVPPNTVTLTTNAIVHALTSYSPKARYAVGLDAKAIRLFQNLLPDSVNDFVIKTFF